MPNCSATAPSAARLDWEAALQKKPVLPVFFKGPVISASKVGEKECARVLSLLLRQGPITQKQLTKETWRHRQLGDVAGRQSRPRPCAPRSRPRAIVKGTRGVAGRAFPTSPLGSKPSQRFADFVSVPLCFRSRPGANAAPQGQAEIGTAEGQNRIAKLDNPDARPRGAGE